MRRVWDPLIHKETLLQVKARMQKFETHPWTRMRTRMPLPLALYLPPRSDPAIVNLPNLSGIRVWRNVPVSQSRVHQGCLEVEERAGRIKQSQHHQRSSCLVQCREERMMRATNPPKAVELGNRPATKCRRRMCQQVPNSNGNVFKSTQEGRAVRGHTNT